MSNKLFSYFCARSGIKSKPRQDSKPDYIHVPANDADIEGIYRYLEWHMYKAGLSSDCFHYLEVLKQEATK